MLSPFRVITLLSGKAIAISKVPATRLHEILTQARLTRIRYEMAVYGGRYKVSSKNDDDLPIFPENNLPSLKHGR